MSGMVKPLCFGRLGNFLFQAAATMGYAWRHDLEFTLPDSTNNSQWNPIYLQHLVNPNWDPNLPALKIQESTHAYQELPFREEWRDKNIILQGYWQSEKYFKEFRERLLEAFGFPWNPEPGVVSVHVRRGDYLKLPHKHPPQTKEWIDKAMGLFSGVKYRFFSDDIPWCKEVYAGREDVEFSEGNDEITDLIGGSQCEHQICSASTFSWWQAYLNRNPNKKIIMPDWWFVPGHGGLDTRDIIPKEWTRLGS